MAVEYAVCIALIVGTILAAGSFVGSRIQSVFSHQMIAGQAEQIASARPTLSAAGNMTSKSVGAAPSAGIPLGVWLAIGGAAVIPSVITFWLVRRRAANAAPSDESSTPVPKDLQARFVVKRQAILHFLSAETRQLAHGQMLVRQVMSTSVLTRAPHDDVNELRELMKESVVRHMLVCSPSGALVGIVSDRDINGEHGEFVSDIMTPNPITVGPEMPVGTVTTIMLAKSINCVPVVEDGKLLGIVTTSDLLMALQCVLRLIEQLSLPADIGQRATESELCTAC